MSVIVPIVIIAVLILLNGLFVAAEFGIVGAPRARIAQRAAQGDRISQMVNRVLTNPLNQDRYIATSQLGITFATIGLGMYGEHQLAVWIAGGLEELGAARWIAAHTVATVLAVVVMTYFHVVVGEMVPKSLALLHAEGTARIVTPPMLAMKVALYPMVLLLNGTGNGFLRLVGIDRSAGSAEQYHTPEELQVIVQESLEGGALRPESGRVVRELFEFGELTAGELMVPRVRVAGIPLDAGAEEMAAVLKESAHTRYPVFDGDLDHIVGVLHVKDVLRALMTGGRASQGQLRTVAHVPETAHVDAVLRVMRQQANHMVVVMDEQGGTAGILTSEDLFEEVVGEIEEEPLAVHEVIGGPGGWVRSSGTARLEDVGDQISRHLEHEEVNTVSGLVLMLLDRPPTVGDRVTYEGVTFEVTGVEGHGVEEALITVPTRAPVKDS